MPVWCRRLGAPVARRHTARWRRWVITGLSGFSSRLYKRSNWHGDQSERTIGICCGRRVSRKRRVPPRASCLAISIGCWRRNGHTRSRYNSIGKSEDRRCARVNVWERWC